jgi:hypothetical protein
MKTPFTSHPCLKKTILNKTKVSFAYLENQRLKSQEITEIFR